MAPLSIDESNPPEEPDRTIDSELTRRNQERIVRSSNPAKSDNLKSDPRFEATYSIPCLGNYQILDFLGQGGMGTVYRARHTKLDKEVAFKLIRSSDQSAQASARFERELRAAGKLDHPNIVRALDAGEINGISFLSMELLEGVDLDEVARPGDRLNQAKNTRDVDHLADELSAKYQVPKRIGTEFLEQNRLILFLDGLDEVRLADQGACVDAINQFLGNNAVPGVLVCSRVDDYALIEKKLNLQSAVVIKPLTTDQILSSISDSESGASRLRASLEEHHTLLDLASSPLMLSVMKLTYGDESGGSAKSFDTLEEAREHLFDTFIDRTFHQKGKSESSYTKAETVSWLAWIANRMKSRSQTVFLVEELQPDWLVSRSHRFIYLLAFSLIHGLVSGLFTINYWYHAMPIMDTSSWTRRHRRQSLRCFGY